VTTEWFDIFSNGVRHNGTPNCQKTKPATLHIKCRSSNESAPRVDFS